LVRGSKGSINALIIFTRQKEAFFEQLTVRFEEPKEIEFKITESTEDLSKTEPKDPARWNTPKPNTTKIEAKKQPKSKQNTY
jgi:hypothetical protein